MTARLESSTGAMVRRAAAALAWTTAVGIGCYKGAAPEPVPLVPAAARPASSAAAAADALALALDGGVPPRGANALDPHVDPEAQRLLRAALERPAVPFDAQKPPAVTLRGLENTALGEARGLKPDGPPLVAALKEGQRAAHPVVLPARGCATFIAQGGLGVIEVDLFLAKGEGEALQVIAEDERGGPISVIGGHGGCLANPGAEPLQATLHLTLRRGNGVVLLRTFTR